MCQNNDGDKPKDQSPSSWYGSQAARLDPKERRRITDRRDPRNPDGPGWQPPSGPRRPRNR